MEDKPTLLKDGRVPKMWKILYKQNTFTGDYVTLVFDWEKRENGKIDSLYRWTDIGHQESSKESRRIYFLPQVLDRNARDEWFIVAQVAHEEDQRLQRHTKTFI